MVTSVVIRFGHLQVKLCEFCSPGGRREGAQDLCPKWAGFPGTNIGRGSRCCNLKVSHCIHNQAPTALPPHIHTHCHSQATPARPTSSSTLSLHPRSHSPRAAAGTQFLPAGIQGDAPQ